MDIKSQIEAILKQELPNFHTEINPFNFLSLQGVWITIAASNHCINRVPEQYPQRVTLSLNLFNNNRSDVELTKASNRIYLKPDLTKEEEKHYAMIGVKIPFRANRNGVESCLTSIRKFCADYKRILSLNKDRLMYQDIVDYNKLLNV